MNGTKLYHEAIGRIAVLTAERDSLRDLLSLLIDAHYGIGFHHIGDGDGIPEDEASALREFAEADLIRRHPNLYAATK